MAHPPYQVHADPHPAEGFLRVKGPDCSSELIGLYDVIARLLSLTLQYVAPFEMVGKLLAEVNLAPAAGIWRLSAGGCRPERATSPRMPAP